MDCASQAALEVLQIRGTDTVPGMLVIVHTFGRDLKFIDTYRFVNQVPLRDGDDALD